LSSGLRFGCFEVRPDERQLLVDGAAAPLGSRAFDLLIALIERRERVVGKNELLDLVWPGMVVEENNLQVQVNTLRKLRGPQAIATVPGRGYRFTLASQQGATESPSSGLPSDVLPRLLTSFVGRQAELETLARLLDTSRLLSLTGIGGSGKTRLAIELGRRVAQRYPDGVWFADLALVNSPERVVLGVARAAGVVEELNRPMQDTLVKQLASRTGLLILDNCEHLLDACAALVESLLIGSERLRVVATSREALGVSGEQVFGVRSLSLPAPATGVEAALASEAVQLFISRAHLVLPEFVLDAQNVAGVIEICRRLDGIPLAIELAAARLRVLSVEQIRDRLGDRFRLLTAGSHTVARHQTLQATLQWSYDHLTPDEQSLLQRVSVFAGGWTLEAAIAVARQGESEIDLVDRLGRLFDKSLLTVDRNSGGVTRYGMLETVRQYARERLQESGETAAIHDAHLAYFLRFATEAQEQIPTELVATLARIDSEIANLVAAHAWCDQPHVPPECGLELVAKLRRYWIERDQFTLGQQLFDQALRRPGVEQPTVQRAVALFSLGQHLHLAGRHAEAVAPLTEALALARTRNNRSLSVWCLSKLSGAHLKLGGLQEARTCVDEGVGLARAIGSGNEVSAVLAALGDVCRFQGRFEDAAAAYEESNALCSRGDLGNRHAHTRNVAYAAIAQGRLDYAGKLLIDCIGMAREYDPHLRNHRDLEVAGHLAAAYGDWTRAARIRGAVDAAADRLGVARDAWGDRFAQTLLEKPCQALGEEVYNAARKDGYALTFAAALDEVVDWLDEPTRGIGT
jgi:predicted ATPase/DNA-binding winged helix-turn-helix (wHTH) protein